MKDKTQGLKNYAKQRNKETFNKVDKAILRLKRSKTKKINFKTVAEEAGVAIATLYNNKQLKTRIESLRALHNDKNSNESKLEIKKYDYEKDKIKALYKEIKQLKEDKKLLILQLVEMEELKIKNNKLQTQLNKVISSKIDNPK